MECAKAEIVRSQAGHDKGDFFCVVGTDGNYLLLCDGKRKKQASPKRKKAMHTVAAGVFCHPSLDKLRAGETVTDSEIRRALAAFRTESRRV